MKRAPKPPPVHFFVLHISCPCHAGTISVVLMLKAVHIDNGDVCRWTPPCSTDLSISSACEHSLTHQPTVLAAPIGNPRGWQEKRSLQSRGLPPCRGSRANMNRTQVKSKVYTQKSKPETAVHGQLANSENWAWPRPLPCSHSSLLRQLYQKPPYILHGVLNIRWMAFPELSSRCFLGPGIKKTVYKFICICAGTAWTPWIKRTASKLVVEGEWEGAEGLMYLYISFWTMEILSWQLCFVYFMMRTILKVFRT